MFIYRWLYRPGKTDVADPLSRNPAVVSAILPVAGPVAGHCAAVHCLGFRQQLTFKWAQSMGGHEISEPLCAEVMAAVAATTRSKVRKLTPSLVPAFEHEKASNSQASVEQVPSPLT